MIFQYNPYAIPLVIATLLGLAGAAFTYHRRKAVGSMTLFFLLLATSEWTLSYALELSSANLSAQIFWSKVEYFGISSVAALYLLFCLEYTLQRRLLNSKRVLPIWIVPILVLALAWTNELHHLLWVSFNQVDLFGSTILEVGHGPAFWLIIVFSYSLLVAGAIVIIRRAFVGSKSERGQSWIMMLGGFVTLAGNMLYVTKQSPFPALDLTPFTLLISAAIFSWGLLRMGLVELIPIASEAVLESMNDGVMVVDIYDRIIYINKAFEYYTRIDAHHAIGMLATVALEKIPSLAAITQREASVRSEIIIDMDRGYPIYFEVHVSQVLNKARKVVGRVFVLDEITERKQAERRLQISTDEDNGSLNNSSIIPLMLAYRLSDGKIVEVNRTFIMELGYTRTEATGQTPLQLGLWTPEQRADFIRQLREGNLPNYEMALFDRSGKVKTYTISAHSSEIHNEKYIVWLGQMVK